MSFTQNKFSSLSPLNQKKKFAYAISEYLDGRQPLSYISDMLSWYNHSAGSDILNCPENKREWQMIQQRLVQEVEQLGQHNDVRLFDGEPQSGQGIIVLDNIRAPYNVGGIMRSAEAFNAEKVIMCGITPTAENAKVRRSAMNVPIKTEYYEKTIDALKHCRQSGYYIISIEKTKTSENIENLVDLPPVSQRVLVLGNEEFGIDEEVLSFSDRICHIRLTGSKNSLNVCTAAGIAMYCLM